MARSSGARVLGWPLVGVRMPPDPDNERLEVAGMPFGLVECQTRRLGALDVNGGWSGVFVGDGDVRVHGFGGFDRDRGPAWSGGGGGVASDPFPVVARRGGRVGW